MHVISGGHTGSTPCKLVARMPPTGGPEAFGNGKDQSMKKIVTTLLAVAFLAGPAFAVDQETKDAAKAQSQQQYIEQTHRGTPAKKVKKAKKDPNNSTKPEAPKTETKPSTTPVK